MTRQGEEALTKLGQTATEAKLKSDSIDTKVKEAEARVTKRRQNLAITQQKVWRARCQSNRNDRPPECSEYESIGK